MQGGGVGSNYSNRYLEEMPKLETGIDLHIVCREDHPNLEEFYHLLTDVVVGDKVEHGAPLVVPDSREGWVGTVEAVMRHAWQDTKTISREAKLVIDVSQESPSRPPAASPAAPAPSSRC
jgi:hypothetical protein